MTCTLFTRALGTVTHTDKSFQSNKVKDKWSNQLTIHSFQSLRYLDDLDAERCAQNDPLTQAFERNKEVKKRAEDEPELKKEYLKLSERCKTFATDLYNGCRSMKEITALLDIDEEKFSLSKGKKVDKESRANVVTKLRRAMESDHKEVGS